MARHPDAAVEPRAAQVAYREAVDVLGIGAGQVLPQRIGGVQVPETGLARGLDVVGVEITLRPAQVIAGRRSEEHTSELQSLMRISYAVFCLKKKKNKTK